MKKDKEFRRKLSEKLENFEAQPQGNTWDKIRFSVDLKEKMQDYEANPDDNIWNNINLPLQLQRKFEPYKAEPRASTWENIQAALQEKEKRKIIVLPMIYRVGIVAGIVLSLFGIMQLLLNQERPLAIKKSSSNLAIATKEDKKTIHKSENKPQNISIFNNIIEKQIPEQYASEPDISVFQKADSMPSAQAKQIIEQNTTAYEQTIPSLEFMESKTIEPLMTNIPSSKISFESSSNVRHHQERKKMTITAGIMPLQTYQAMTILPQSNTYIQQINNLNALDAQRLGVQARLGFLQTISKKFSSGVSLSYSGLQQVINYETNSGNYQLQLNDNQSYQLVGISENVNQQKFLHSLGIKIDNAIQISKKKNKVVLLGGGEAVRVLNDNRFSYYLNASIAFSYSNRNGKNVWIEPSYRYNLSQTPDVNNYLQVRASNIGLNVRVNFM